MNMYMLLTEDPIQNLYDAWTLITSAGNLINFSSSVVGLLAAIVGMITGFIGLLTTLVSAVGVVVAAIVAGCITLFNYIFTFVLPAIALFILARKAGYKHPWLAFVPIAQTYLEFVLPRRKFKTGIINTYKRNIIAIITLLIPFIGTPILTAIVGVLGVIPVLGQVIIAISPFILPAFLYLMNWRRMYDMIATFRDKEVAIPISIFSLFIPWIYTISLLRSLKCEPEYGVGGYYNVKMGEDKKSKKEKSDENVDDTVVSEVVNNAVDNVEA